MNHPTPALLFVLALVGCSLGLESSFEQGQGKPSVSPLITLGCVASLVLGYNGMFLWSIIKQDQPDQWT
ncbi:hypothetical protein K493DRAFT_346025 [Basidiobolus meristosporus CBS 931.73]|uniref:Uncharacterized protein n=1 Tax=Basidiobolus meristosporus CBS 931.73 TaxID=1314790 RepID=A0A1Y1Z0S9_9FUNG|nr:hypothetical protein K493DRAFT_364691 [Basidiobolus meristosporus CBS 931.73]ORY03724.1 hypothetical protein K493DRAFT_346025 [Basidiobolus meristosporus CBS 931.73]|eukprot:ORX65329.1 hypothetical protein K493DRAFT_364691 [Basidiobolus meristosporus CBS 931.73]